MKISAVGPRLLCAIVACLGALALAPAVASAAWVTVKIQGYGNVEQTEGDKDIHCWSPDTTPTGQEGNSCGSSETFGTGVRFEAHAPAGWRFEGWSGACSDSGSCAFTTFTGEYVLTARFVDDRDPTTTIDAGPPRSAPISQSWATFNFSANEPGTGFQCSLDGGGWDWCGSGHTYWGLDTREHRFRVKAVDPSGRWGPAEEWVWTVDVTGPPTDIARPPANPTKSTTASFDVSSDTGSVIRCRIDGGAWETCTGTYTRTGLAEGLHTFNAYATDSLGNGGPIAEHRWRIDVTAPTTTALPWVGPSDGSVTDADLARFEFVADEAVQRYECSLDGGTFAPCVSPKEYSGLQPGEHTFKVRAVDVAGNVGGSANRAWRVAVRDADRDGFSPPADCRDDDAAINPMAVDVPDNAVDEDCKDGPAIDWDRDDDGYPRPQDCRDDHASINPGAREVPGNTVDEDCVDGPGDYPVLDSRVTFAYASKRGGTVFTTLAVKKARAGSTIVVKCKGRRCPKLKRPRVTVTRDAAQLSIRRVLRGAALRPGLVLEIRISRPGMYGVSRTFTVRRNQAPKTRDGCLMPGSGKRARCPS